MQASQKLLDRPNAHRFAELPVHAVPVFGHALPVFKTVLEMVRNGFKKLLESD